MGKHDHYLQKFRLEFYNNLQEPSDSARCLDEIERFMVLVEDNALEDPKPVIMEFCDFVEHDDVWHLATMVVPQFRYSRLEK